MHAWKNHDPAPDLAAVGAAVTAEVADALVRRLVSQLKEDHAQFSYYAKEFRFAACAALRDKIGALLSAIAEERAMEAQNELRVEALRLAIGRNNPVLKQDGTLVTVPAADVVQDAQVLFTFLKG